MANIQESILDPQMLRLKRALANDHPKAGHKEDDLIKIYKNLKEINTPVKNQDSEPQSSRVISSLEK